MPSLMPSLLKYFMAVGAILFVALVGLNAVLEPGGPGPRIVQDSPKPKLVRHDPRASLVERLREEEAAQTASGRAEAKPVQPGTAGTPAPVQVAPARPAVTQAAALAQPVAAKPMVDPPVAPAQVQAAAPAAEHHSAPAALTGVATEDEERATRLAHEKAAADKARKKRVAKERARVRSIEDTPASRHQDQYYYAQRAPAPAYAYAPPPRPVYGPFSQNQGWFGSSWGRGW
jgi:hypothetical protein